MAWEQVVGNEGGMKTVRVLVKVMVVIVVVAALGSGGTIYLKSHAATKPTESFQTTVIKRGELLSTISATGTVEPEEVVNVGAQVAGLIVEFGTDPHDPAKLIDYGTVVEKDDVLARIDPTFYEAALEQAEATLRTVGSQSAAT